MKKTLLAVAVMTLGLAACGGKSGERNVAVEEPDVVLNVDECPRADGAPCR